MRGEAATLGKLQQHGLHLWSEIDENPDKAAGPRKLHRLLQGGSARSSFSLPRERQGPHGQDLDLAADAEGALGNLKQCRQAVKRRLYVGRCAARQQELGPGQMWVLQPGQQAIRHRRCVNICPAEGRVRVSLPVRQLCPQRTRIVAFLAKSIQVKLAEQPHDLPGCGVIAPGRMHPHQADHTIVGGLRMRSVAFVDEFGKVLAGGVQFIPAIVDHAEKVVRPALKHGELAQRCLLEHHLRQFPYLLELAGLEGVKTHGEQEAQRIGVYPSV